MASKDNTKDLTDATATRRSLGRPWPLPTLQSSSPPDTGEGSPGAGVTHGHHSDLQTIPDLSGPW